MHLSIRTIEYYVDILKCKLHRKVKRFGYINWVAKETRQCYSLNFVILAFIYHRLYLRKINSHG